jgi:hypothetical protein
MSLLKQLTDYVKSPEAKAKAQELAEQAKQFANDPKRKEEFESVKRKVSEKLGKDDAPKPAADSDAPKPAA